MVQTRAAPRYRVAKAARIEHGGDKIACTLYDLSTTGAAIEVANPAAIPAAFTLDLPEHGLNLRCRVIRRANYRIGVAFE
jgi:hypothetical protein